LFAGARRSERAKIKAAATAMVPRATRRPRISASPADEHRPEQEPTVAEGCDDRDRPSSTSGSEVSGHREGHGNCRRKRETYHEEPDNDEDRL
jgi:hypothetical protein